MPAMIASPSIESRYIVPSLERALSIVELMAREPGSCGITDLAEKLALPKNSVFRILRTLYARGYLTEAGRQYRLSAKLLSLGYASLGEVNLVEKSIDIMRELRDEAKETVLIGTMAGGEEGVVLEQVLGSFEIKFAIDVGHRFYLHTAAPGKAMLAYLPDDELDRALDALTFPRFNRRTVTNREEMLRVLHKARAEGYAVDTAERIEGLHGVACPILNYLSYPVAAIWITGPGHRMPQREFARLGAIVHRHSLRISQRLGFEPQQEGERARVPAGGRGPSE